MNSFLLYIIVILIFANLIAILKKKNTLDINVFKNDFEKISSDILKIDSSIRDEFSRHREENQRSAKDIREELNNSFKNLAETLSKNITSLGQLQKDQLLTFSTQLQNLTTTNEDKIEKLIIANNSKQNEFKEQLTFSLKDSKNEISKSAKETKENVTAALKSFEDNFSLNVKEFNELQRQKFNDLFTRHESLKSDTENKLETIRAAVENKLTTLQQENTKKLEEMRLTVDEKLQATVERRFNESFKLISDRLEQVHKGLGEMQTLASGVGDLKKVLTNVKTRGNLGEIQLGTILEQYLSPEQYEQNAAVKKGSQERVEYVIKFPGRNEEQQPLLLPVDSKFPNEDYQRLLEAYETTNLDSNQLDVIHKQFENAVKKNAKEIKAKYINPPSTTDFAIMFVPTEGLYAEIVRRTGLFEILQRDYKIIVVGPTNLVALLNSLQMGFRTLAVEKRSSEVWEILGAIKTEFGKFGDILQKTKKKLQEASNTIDSAEVRTREITRKLKNVQELPASHASLILGDSLDNEIDSNDKVEIGEVA